MAGYDVNVGKDLLPGLLSGQDGLAKLVEAVLNQILEAQVVESIGENIGRNGNRLWPDAREVGNEFFRQLPERLRLNSHTGIVDFEIPDKDYSVGCFEGIRSEDIESTLDIWFQQGHIYRRNCFLWRIVNLAYSDNYDLMSIIDRSWLKQAVRAEYVYYKNGGRGTELHGVYRPRVI